MIISKTPLRISFCGGGSDIASFYRKHGGCVISTSIDKYIYISSVRSFNPDVTLLKYSVVEETRDLSDIRHPVFKAMLNEFDMPGYEINSTSDIPAGTGLGSSSTFTVGLSNLLRTRRGENPDKETLANDACRIEIDVLGEPIGKQDQYAAVFGGFNFMKFSGSGVNVNRVRIHPDTISELQYCSVLCYTGNPRESAKIIESQVEKFNKGQNEEALDKTKELTKDMVVALEKGNIDEAGRLLDVSWDYKKQFSSKITNPQIDALYNAAKDNGAIGGKVSGAGGGGFMYFICRYDRKYDVARTLQGMGARVTDYMFEPEGVISWRYPHE